LLKKLKLTTDESATNKPTTDEPLNDEPISEPTTLESISDPAIIKPYIMEPLDTLREAICREGPNEVIVRSTLASLIEVNETTISRIVESDLPIISYTNGIAILDEYFPKSAIDLRPLNSVVTLNELLTSIANTCRNTPLIPLIPSFAPEALSTSSDTVSLKALGILDPYKSINGFEMLTPNTGSPESVSSCRDSTSCLSSKTNSTDINLLDIVIYTPFVR